jgi:hypothetical protein
LAVRVARLQGLCRTVSALGLDYYSLKKRLAAADGNGEATNRGASDPRATFVELAAPPIACRQCTIELDDGGGTTLRVQLAGYDAADVAALSRRLWSRR